jgi:hypothetical protein
MQRRSYINTIGGERRTWIFQIERGFFGLEFLFNSFDFHA